MNAQSKWHELRKSTIVLACVFLMLVAEALSGALRFYLDSGGVPLLVYVPKVVVLVVAVVMAILDPRRIKIAAALFLLSLSSLLALSNEASWRNVLFSAYVYSPLLMGILCAPFVFARQCTARKAVLLLLAVCVTGAAIDYFSEVPWKGYSYFVGDVELVANRQWWAAGFDRVGGFARNSALLAMMIGVFAIYLHVTTKRLLVRIALVGFAILAIAATTNKASLVAYAITLVVALIPQLRGAALMVALAVAVTLPAFSIVAGYADRVSAFDLVLSSLSDRMANTWPGFFKLIDDRGGALAGVGFGAVGSSTSVFPLGGTQPDQWPHLGVADNTVLYLWGMFGVLGLVLFMALGVVGRRLLRRPDAIANAMFLVLLFLIIVSWTTDILESAVATLALGIAIGGSLGFPWHTKLRAQS